MIHKLDADRLRYLVKSYQACRLKLIEEYARYYLSNKVQVCLIQRHLLDNKEVEYAIAFHDLESAYYRGTVLAHLPQNMQNIEFDAKPDEGVCVVFTATKNVGAVKIE